MDLGTAEKIIECFGYCTVIGECYTPKELLESIEYHGSVKEWLRIEFRVMPIRDERDGTNEAKSIKKIKARLKAAGIKF